MQKSVNFVISTRGRQLGLDHLGIQAESGDELKEIYARLHEAGGTVVEQGQMSCCYARPEKSWIDDPAASSITCSRNPRRFRRRRLQPPSRSKLIPAPVR